MAEAAASCVESVVSVEVSKSILGNSSVCKSCPAHFRGLKRTFALPNRDRHCTQHYRHRQSRRRAPAPGVRTCATACRSLQLACRTDRRACPMTKRGAALTILDRIVHWRSRRPVLGLAQTGLRHSKHYLCPHHIYTYLNS